MTFLPEDDTITLGEYRRNREEERMAETTGRLAGRCGATTWEATPCGEPTHPDDLRCPDHGGRDLSDGLVGRCGATVNVDGPRHTVRVPAACGKPTASWDDTRCPDHGGPER